MNDTLTQALDLAECGYPLFPLVPGGKTPALTGNWQNAATRDLPALAPSSAGSPAATATSPSPASPAASSP
jgi:hypothetical protein